jgi:predicted nucleotidyltransferase
VLQTLHDHAAELQRRGVARIGVFGSIVRAEAAAGSDVDIRVELEQPSLAGFVGL